jgi:hypothetical protein
MLQKDGAKQEQASVSVLNKSKVAALSFVKQLKYFFKALRLILLRVVQQLQLVVVPVIFHTVGLQDLMSIFSVELFFFHGITSHCEGP